jgi:hypothetical protein
MSKPAHSSRRVCPLRAFKLSSRRRRLGFGDFHHGTRRRLPGEEPQRAAGSWIALDDPRPPSRETLGRRERLADARGRCGNPHAMTDIGHVFLLL